MAGYDIPMRALRQQVSAAVQIVVQARRVTGGRRKVVSVSEITGMEGDAIQMHDLGLISSPGELRPRTEAPKAKQKDEPPASYDWYCLPAQNIPPKHSESWRAQDSSSRRWAGCTLPLEFDDEFRQTLATAAGRAADSLSPSEILYFRRAFSVPSSAAARPAGFGSQFVKSVA